MAREKMHSEKPKTTTKVWVQKVFGTQVTDSTVPISNPFEALEHVPEHQPESQDHRTLPARSNILDGSFLPRPSLLTGMSLVLIRMTDCLEGTSVPSHPRSAPSSPGTPSGPSRKRERVTRFGCSGIITWKSRLRKTMCSLSMLGYQLQCVRKKCWLLLYMCCHIPTRRQLWDGLLATSSTTLPWIVMGYFNVMKGLSEQVRCKALDPLALEDFNDCLMNCRLEDAGYCGSSFSWTNGRIAKRLDRVLHNEIYGSSTPGQGQAANKDFF
ncbi:hypothetical protein LIER_28968 [Lithospermum erythrorhizon]|uniref:Uncharacterized protein n=1 Tax=Lithospermum erythrorhizon TaxID=34254 RepID=A0AAV3RNI0_LITER